MNSEAVEREHRCVFRAAHEDRKRDAREAGAGSGSRDLVGLRDSLAPRDVTENVAAKVVEGATGSREDPAANPLAFVQQPEEDVLDV